jgi:regulator of sigma E protease
VAVDGAPVRSWQDLRWRLLKSSGRGEVTLEVERAATGDTSERSTHTLPLATVAMADWEGNFMPLLGLKADFGAPLIDEVVPGKPADRAGLRAGDRIVAVDGAAVRSPADVAARTNAKPGASVTFRILRDGAEQDVTFTTEASGEGARRVGLAGVRLKIDPAIAERLGVTVRYGVADARVEGARKTWELSVFTLKMLGRIVTGDASLKNISGPITLADYAGQSAQAGLLVFVGYLALISISLGVLNLLPIPLLDGGHLLYYFAELIKGSPLSDRAFELGQRIGMAMLAVMMALALFNDLSRLF